MRTALLVLLVIVFAAVYCPFVADYIKHWQRRTIAGMLDEAFYKVFLLLFFFVALPIGYVYFVYLWAVLDTPSLLLPVGLALFPLGMGLGLWSLLFGVPAFLVTP